jgi:hypothetical protein
VSDARLLFCKSTGRGSETQPLTVAAKSRNPTLAVGPTRLGLPSPGGSVRDPPAAPAVAVRAA